MLMDTPHDHHAPPAAMAMHAPDPLMQRARTLGSGTSLLPATSPMRMWSLRTDDWLWMAHGDVVAGLNRQPSSITVAGENWAMLMGTRALGPGLLDLRLMASLEALTLPAGGTPQLFQAGETYQGLPLVNAQHPHDLAMEIAARYTWNLAENASLFLYGGPVGEPALGPVAFMHRPSAADNHNAPLAHHLQDSTHYVFGVGTLGARLGPVQVEGSLFNGREPDEQRFGLEFGAWDSWSTRVSMALAPTLTAQVSYGHLKNPEALAPGDVNKASASLLHVHEFAGGTWSNSLVWGQATEFHDGERVLQSYGAESQLDLGANHAYGRLELLDRAGLLPDHRFARVTAFTLGGVRDLDTSPHFDLGLGAEATVYSPDSAFAAGYGDNPFAARVFLRLRPPTMAH